MNSLFYTYKYLIPIVLPIVLIIGLLSSCDKADSLETRLKPFKNEENNTASTSAHSILVVHSWDNTEQEGFYFDQKLKEAFKDRGIEVNLHHIFLDAKYNNIDEFEKNEYHEINNSVVYNWEPELILVNDDAAIEWLMKHHRNDHVFTDKPIVYAGVNTLDKEFHNSFPFATGFIDSIDIEKNVDIIRNVAHQNYTAMVLGNTPRQLQLRENIEQQIAKNKDYIYNKGFYLSEAEVLKLDKKGEKFVLAFVAVSHPELNTLNGDLQAGTNRLHDLFRNSKLRNQLQIDYDLFSNTLIDHSLKPQFSAIREQFNTSRARILCGYFTTLETQIEDQVLYASKILEGATPRNLPQKTHKSTYNLDYNALKRLYSGSELQDKYDELSDRFNIINAPFSVAHNSLFKLLVVVSIILFVVLAIILCFYLLRYRNITLLKEQNATKRKLEQRKQLFELSKTSTWIYYIDKEILHVSYTFITGHKGEAIDIPYDELVKRSHPDYIDNVAGIVRSIQKRGTYETLLLVSFDQGQTYSYYQANYNVTAANQRSRQIMGVVYNTTPQILREQKLNDALTEANELVKKQEFIENVDNSILKPTNDILNATKYIINADLSATDATPQYDTIQKSTKQLLSILDNAIGKAESKHTDITNSKHNLEQESASSDLFSINKDKVRAVHKRLSKLSTILIIAFCLTASLFTSSCSSPNEKLTNKKILIIHSYDQDLPDYKAFDALLEEKLNKELTNPDICNLYLNITDYTQTGNAAVKNLSDSLNRIGWTPDLIMIEGDEAASAMSLQENIELMPYVKTSPIAYGGLYVPDWKAIRMDKRSIIYVDPINFDCNIRVAVNMSGQNVVEIELDHARKDSVLRQKLIASIAHPPFVDNSDFHETRLDRFSLKTVYRDSIMIIARSAEYNEQDYSNKKYYSADSTNDKNNTDSTTYSDSPQDISLTNPNFASLVVKKDIFSNAIADKKNKPQFTAIREGFEDGENKYLAGFFTSYPIVATDMVNSAVDLLLGITTPVVGIHSHDQHFYMNYQAMQVLGLDYEEYCHDYIIIGAPYKVTNPIEYWTLITGSSLLLLIFVFSIIYIIIGKYNYNLRKLNRQIANEHELSNIALEGRDHVSIQNRHNIIEIAERIHPDFSDVAKKIQDNIDVVGTYQFEVRLSPDNNDHYEWWKIYYVIQSDKNGQLTYDGMVISNEEEHKINQQLAHAIKLAEEARIKENFLMKLRHEIRTPLNIIQGACNILSGQLSVSLTPDEIRDYKQALLQNRLILRTMITDIIIFSQNDRGTIKYNISNLSVDKFVANYYDKAQQFIKGNVKMVLAKGVDNLSINVDKKYLLHIIRELITNAVKYTDIGTISLGWQYHIASDEVEMFVQDTGRGIAKIKHDSVFDMFWKDDGFVPGLGLGLYITKTLVEGMGGRISVDSHPGIGSRFSIYFKQTKK